MRRLGALLILAALALAFCHPTEQPPLPPPKPTNPTALVAQDPDLVIDASIVTEGGSTWDSEFELDAGTGVRRTTSQ
jgi:hypothetical protein